MLLATAYGDDATFHAIAVDSDTLQGILVFREPDEDGEPVAAVLAPLTAGDGAASLRMTDEDVEWLGISRDAFAELNAGLAVDRVRESGRRARG